MDGGIRRGGDGGVTSQEGLDTSRFGIDHVLECGFPELPVPEMLFFRRQETLESMLPGSAGVIHRDQAVGLEVVVLTQLPEANFA